MSLSETVKGASSKVSFMYSDDMDKRILEVYKDANINGNASVSDVISASVRNEGVSLLGRDKDVYTRMIRLGLFKELVEKRIIEILNIDFSLLRDTDAIILKSITMEGLSLIGCEYQVEAYIKGMRKLMQNAKNYNSLSVADKIKNKIENLEGGRSSLMVEYNQMVESDAKEKLKAMITYYNFFIELINVKGYKQAYKKLTLLIKHTNDFQDLITDNALNFDNKKIVSDTLVKLSSLIDIRNTLDLTSRQI